MQPLMIGLTQLVGDGCSGRDDLLNDRVNLSSAGIGIDCVDFLEGPVLRRDVALLDLLLIKALDDRADVGCDVGDRLWVDVGRDLPPSFDQRRKSSPIPRAVGIGNVFGQRDRFVRRLAAAEYADLFLDRFDLRSGDRRESERARRGPVGQDADFARRPGVGDRSRT